MNCKCSCEKHPKKKKLTVKRALEDLLKHYVGLVNSGDAGNWNPEDEQVVINARQMLERKELKHGTSL